MLTFVLLRRVFTFENKYEVDRTADENGNQKRSGEAKTQGKKMLLIFVNNCFHWPT
jgi:hypothetical protein